MNKKATKAYIAKRVKYLNQCLGYGKYNNRRIKEDTFSDCTTEIQVDNRFRKLLMQG